LANEIEQILVFAGGTDSTGATLEIANYLRTLKTFKRAIIYSDLIDAVSELDSRFLVKPYGSSLDFDIDSSQVVLTTASTSSLEIIARGIPLGVICVVQNQMSYYRKLGELGVVSQIGIRDEDGFLILCEAELKRLISDFSYRESLILAGKNLIDLSGPKRVVDAIVNW
jgi:spore coat polysaccharide biosynthesis predicted glycosyltransferase SpsG